MTKPDLDLSDFDAELRQVPRCKVCALLDELPEGRRANLAHVLGDLKGYPAGAISRAVTKWGHPVSDTTVNKHRRECR